MHSVIEIFFNCQFFSIAGNRNLNFQRLVSLETVHARPGKLYILSKQKLKLLVEKRVEPLRRAEIKARAWQVL